MPHNLATLLLGALHGFAAAWERLMERNAARGRAADSDDIAWVSGEPDEATEG